MLIPLKFFFPAFASLSLVTTGGVLINSVSTQNEERDPNDIIPPPILPAQDLLGEENDEEELNNFKSKDDRLKEEKKDRTN